ncbi:hypothetical protein ABPG74_008201 [Tetrahymena malaccensis]
MIASRNYSQFGENSSQNSRAMVPNQQVMGIPKIMCGDHQGFVLTHFCSKIQCLKGLCQKCIKEHNQYHKDRKEYAEIETLEDISSNCQQRILTCLKDYTEEQENVQQQIKSEEQHHKSQQVLQKMSEAESQCQNIVQSYFETVRKEYDIALRKMDAEKQKMNKQLQEIENEKNKLNGFLRELQENQFQISTLQHILKLDFSIFINERLGVIGQYFEQLISVTPSITINFENVHRQIYEICQNTCFLTYSGQSPKQKSITQLRQEISINNRKASVPSNYNGTSDQNGNSQRNITLSPFKSNNYNAPAQLNNFNNSSQFSQNSERSYNEYAGMQQQRNKSYSPAPDSRLIAQQTSSIVRPNQQPKIPLLSNAENSQSQQDDKYTPVSKKMKMKIFDTKPNLLSSPRPPINQSQQSLKSSIAPKIEENKSNGQYQGNILQSNNINNVHSSQNITPNFLTSKNSNAQNTGYSSFNSNLPQTFNHQNENQISSLNNFNSLNNFTEQSKNQQSNFANIKFNPTPPRNEIQISSSNIPQNQQQNYAQDQAQLNSQMQQPQFSRNELLNNNQPQASLAQNQLASVYPKSQFGQSIQISQQNNNNNNNSINNLGGNNLFQQDINNKGTMQMKNIPEDMSSNFNRGNSFNPSQTQDNYNYSNNNVNMLQHIPQKYKQVQNAKQFIPEESQDYQESQNIGQNINNPNQQYSHIQSPQNEIYGLSAQNNYSNTPQQYNSQYGQQNQNQSAAMNNNPNHKKSNNEDAYNINSQNNHRQVELRDSTQKEFQVQMTNYLKSESNYQYLHFFQPKSNILHIVNVQDVKQASNGSSQNSYLKFYSIQMKTDDPSFTVPRFHKSITLRDGSIYLMGGVSPSSNHSKTVYKYEFTKNKLQAVSEMITGRSGFGCVYSPFNHSIYVIGGASDEDGVTNQCERYDINTNKWSSISYLNNPTFNPAVCYFQAPNGKNYLFKFAGKIDDDNLDTTIERYDLQSDRWEIIPTQTQIPILLSSANCCQINSNNILVFGGVYTQSQEKASTCFLLNINLDPITKNQLVHEIKGINQIELPNAEGFSNQQSFIHDNQLYTIQNVSEKKNPDIIYLDRKRIISFNSHSWMVLNNIELLEKNN